MNDSNVDDDALEAQRLELSPRAFSVLCVMNDLKDAFTTLLEKKNKHPALLMIYAFIDICAALSSDGSEKTNQRVFRAYLERSMTPGSQRAITPLQLWAARSALLHSFSPLGHHTGPGKAPPTFYYAYPETKEDMRKSLVARGYADFAVLSVSEVKSIAVWAFNEMIMKMERDNGFQELVVRNAEHLLLTEDALQVENFVRDVRAGRKEETAKSE